MSRKNPFFEAECPFSGDKVFSVIDPVKPSEVSIIDRVDHDLVCKGLATGVGVGINAVQRQFFANLKIAFDRGVDMEKIVSEKGVGVLFNGLASRLSFQVVGVMPAIAIRDALEVEGFSTLAATAATSAYETLVGTALEVKSTSKTFPVKSLARGFAYGVVPFYVRNSIGWWVVNHPHESLSDKMMYAAGAGLLTSIPDSVGNMMIGKSSEMGVFNAFNYAMKELTTPAGITRIAKGSPTRAFATMGSAFLLSPESQISLCKLVDRTMSDMQVALLRRIADMHKKDPDEIPVPEEPDGFLTSRQLERIRDMLSHETAVEKLPSAGSQPKSVSQIAAEEKSKDPRS